METMKSQNKSNDILMTGNSKKKQLQSEQHKYVTRQAVVQVEYHGINSEQCKHLIEQIIKFDKGPFKFYVDTHQGGRGLLRFQNIVHEMSTYFDPTYLI